MKIQYDYQIFTNQQYGGISRYFYELIKRFDGVTNSCDVALLLSNNAYYNQDVNPKLKPFFPNSNSRLTNKFFRTVNQQNSSYVERKADFDVFHPTYYDDCFIDKIKGKPFIVTFHDMIHEKFSNQFKELKSDIKIFDGKKRLLEHSSKVIAISETTKIDIVEIFDINPSKIDVVYHGNSLQNFDIGNKRLVDDDYILFVGNRGIYKNFDFFVTSIAELVIDHKLKLICAGGGDFTLQELTLLKSLKLEQHVVLKKIINDDVLANYYTHALFFCFPSLYEGFGIPVLESFACGCPALLSKGGALPEVGGDAALYFDPTDAESLKRPAYELISNEASRLSIKEKGFERLSKFSWDKTYLETLEIYKSVV